MKKEIYNKFTNLTLLDLEEWVGKKSFQRGQSYYKNDSVYDVQTTEDGIIGGVSGTEEYTTYVKFEKNSKPEKYFLSGECSCPVEVDCKHCVALVLKYLELVKAKKKLKEIKLDDEMFEKINNRISDDREDDDFDDYFEEEEDNEYKPKKTKKAKSTSKEDIISGLEKLDKKELLSLIKENMDKNTKLKEALEHKLILTQKKPSQILSSLKKEINLLYKEVEENDDPDFDKIKESLEWLVDNEHNSIPEIMKQLIELGNHAMNFVDEVFYGEEELIECIEIGMRGIEKLDWQDDKKILFCLELKKADEYINTDDLFETIYSNADNEAWSKVADSLLSDIDKIKSLPKDKNQKIDFTAKHEYQNLVKDAVTALENANRKKEILQLLRKEASITEDCHNLIKELMDKKEYKEVKSIIMEQLKTSDEYFYLVSKLKEIAAIENNNEYLLKILMWEYSYRPSMGDYKEIKKISTELKKWKAIQDWILLFLETGNKLFNKENPENYLQTKRGKYFFGNKFPDFREIIEIYIYENNPHKVWEFYNLAAKAYKATPSSFMSLPEDQIAKTIQEIKPNEAIAIWKFLAEKSISQANPNGYSAALPLLKQAKTLLEKIGKQKDWDEYYQDLKLRNKNRPRCLEELAKLSLKKIVEG
jgi:uncharacterized Zn finger protein